MIDIAASRIWSARTEVGELSARAFWIAVGAIAAALATVLAIYLLAWPPHEDETLALFVGRSSLPRLLHVVLGERGGAPLHFVLAWIVAHLGGGLVGLRIVSLIFAVASVPAIAVLGARLADRLVGVVAALLACGSWVLLFHGIYGRMYSLFLFTSALSFIALLDALAYGGRRRFVLWAVALLATLATHPYAALVVAAQGCYVVFRGDRRRPALATLAVVAVAGAPFWWADTVLRARFDVGLGGGGSRLGSPRAVTEYFWWVSGDFSAGHHAWSAPVLVTAAIGFVLLARRRKTSGLLTACVVLVPAVAFLVARLHTSASPEARHLIFALPFFSTLLATAIVDVGRIRPPVTAPVAAAAALVLLVGEVQWAERKTPPLFHGDPAAETHARAAAASWLAATARSDDVLFGYEPLYLEAWERNRSLSSYALPRADPRLLSAALARVPQPLGRGVWVLDASDTTNPRPRESIAYVLPRPASAFVARVFGPYLVVRSRRPLITRERFLRASEEVMELGRTLGIGDADINLHALLITERRLYGVSRSSSSSSRSRSTISR